MSDTPPRIILATSNGTGMGHLARQAAVALALSGPVEPIIFSLSQAVHVVVRHGLRAEYCPSHHRNWMPHLSWHGYLGERLSALLSETGARVLAFDGVAPYLGLLRARAAHPEVAFVWVRRGLWRASANRRALAARTFFDLVVEPGDLAAAADRGATATLTDAVRVPPISVLEAAPPLSRTEAAAAIGLDPDRPTALVTLGAGSINDTRTPALAAIRSFLETPDWQVAVTRAPLALAGLPATAAARVHELVDVYPLARYLSAFDAAVGAAGYNTVHELLPAGVPTLLVPNSATSTDDQMGRARYLAAGRLALCVENDSPEAIARCVGRLVDPAVRSDLAKACKALPALSGASAAAKLLITLMDGYAIHEPTLHERVRTIDFTVRARLMRTLGPLGTTAVRRILGRLPAPGPIQPLGVRPLVTDDLDPDVLRSDGPVEHLLPGSSAAYRLRRLTIAHHAYRWPADSARMPAS
ncbi:MAG: glycosyltransferase [Actinopolymorphaceae bacterium]